ncbi:MAG: DNA-binding protein [Eubacteriales bacterium]|nr:DNA-binding protein [Eubacteriales bacterium]
MEYKRFDNKIIARVDKGEEILCELERICEKENIKHATVSAIGAVSFAEIGCFDTNEKKYYSTKYAGIYEITSLEGTVSAMDGKTYIHIHAAIAGIDNRVIGGHLSHAVVSATCEMVIDIMNGEVSRAFSPEIGLNLLIFK